MNTFYLKNYGRDLDSEDIGVAASYDWKKHIIMLNLYLETRKNSRSINDSLLHEYWHHVEEYLTIDTDCWNRLHTFPTGLYSQTKTYFIKKNEGYLPANQMPKLIEYIYTPTELPAYMFSEAMLSSEIQQPATQYIKDVFDVDVSKINM